MTDRQKFLMTLAYKYVPNYTIINDRDRDVFTLRVWIDDSYVVCITDVPSLTGTNKFQVRVCEQTQSYFSPSPRVGALDRLFGKKYRDGYNKYSVVPADKIEDVISKFSYTAKTTRTALKDSAVWVKHPRDVWF